MSDEEYKSASESSDDKTLAVSVKVEPSTLMVLRCRGSRGPHLGPLLLPPLELSPVVVVSSDENHS